MISCLLRVLVFQLSHLQGVPGDRGRTVIVETRGLMGSLARANNKVIINTATVCINYFPVRP